MTHGPYDSGDKVVLDQILCSRVQQFLDWRSERDSLEARLDAILGRN